MAENNRRAIAHNETVPSVNTEWGCKIATDRHEFGNCVVLLKTARTHYIASLRIASGRSSTDHGVKIRQSTVSCDLLSESGRSYWHSYGMSRSSWDCNFTWLKQKWIFKYKIHISQGIFFWFNLLTYLLTYSMVQSPPWEANWFAASQEIPRISRNPKVHYHTHKRPPPVPILGQPHPVHIPTSHLLEIRPNIIRPSATRSPHTYMRK